MFGESNNDKICHLSKSRSFCADGLLLRTRSDLLHSRDQST